MTVVPWPGSPEYVAEQIIAREHEAAELDRLRALEADLHRPIVELARELVHLREVAAAAEQAAERVAEHERRGYDHIRIGAFAPLRAALAARR